MFRPLCLSLVLTFALALPGAANTPEMNNGDKRDRTGGQNLSDRLTNTVVSILITEFRRCSGIDLYYRTDCYKWVFRMAWQEIDGNRAYRSAQTALEKVDRTLGAFVTANIDRSKPFKLHGVQIYRPIKPEAEPRARAVTARALEEAETVLLRAPDDAGDHYVRIAEAINSNKVLLRSTLRWLGRILRII